MSLIRARKLALLLQSRQNPHLNHLIASGVINLCFIGRPHVGKARQLHCSLRNLAPKPKINNNKLFGMRETRIEYRTKRSSVPPRYVQGPTLPGLRIVVRALQDSGRTMHTREIWNAIHENALGAEYTFPAPEPPKLRQGKDGDIEAIPEPTYPTHPVRSLRYLKAILLPTLEANGRVQKIHSVRPPTEEEKEEFEKHQNKIQARNEKKASKGKEANGIIPQGVDHWVWELITPNSGTTPVEQRQSIPMRATDMVWMRSLDTATYRRFHAPLSALREGEDPEPGSIIEYKSEEEDTSFHAQTNPKSRSYPQVSPSERELADRLATRWQKVALKDAAAAFLAGVPASKEWKIGNEGTKVDWRDREREKEKTARRREFLAASPKHPKPSNSDWSQKQDGETANKDKRERKGSDPNNLGLFNDSPNVEAPPTVKEKRPVVKLDPRKKYLNPKEPEYRQSPLGVNKLPISLMDPRRRQYGFHYGLPKQKELLRAANSNDYYNNAPWKDEDQPPRDYSHLSARRQKRRQEQNTEILRGLKSSAQWKTLKTPLPMIAAPTGQDKRAPWKARTL